MKNWTKKKILNSNAVIRWQNKEISIPIKDVIDESIIDDILSREQDDKYVEWELIDEIYEYFTSTLEIDIV